MPIGISQDKRSSTATVAPLTILRRSVPAAPCYLDDTTLRGRERRPGPSLDCLRRITVAAHPSSCNGVSAHLMYGVGASASCEHFVQTEAPLWFPRPADHPAHLHFYLRPLSPPCLRAALASPL